MPVRRIERVRKRDGRLEAYDEAKLSESIRQAARAAGCDQPALAADLAGVVTTYLERHHGSGEPGSDEIRLMVERVLRENGHGDVADAFLGAGDPSDEADLFPADRFLVDGATRDEVSAWARDRITAALMKEASVDEAVAKEIARAVETRIFARRERRVSTTLIRELVNQELLTRGFGTTFRRQVVVGLPKYDLERLVRPDGDSPDPDALCRTIGETTMKQYALQEIYPREVADAHLEGRLHLHDLEVPQKLFWLAPDLRPKATTARGLTAELAGLAREARRGACAVELTPLNLPYASRPGAAEEAPYVLQELAPCAAGLDLGDAAADAFTRRLLRSWSGTVRTEARLLVAPGAPVADSLLEEACRFAAARPGTILSFRRAGGEAFRRYPVEGSAIGGAVTINLAQAYYRSESGSDFYAELDAALAVAVRAHLRKRGLLRRGEGEPPVAFAVAVAGLDETAWLMTGRTCAEDEGAIRMALRILSYLAFRLREEAARHAVRLELHDAAGPDAAARLFRVDRQIFARARGLEAQTGAEYTTGARLRTPRDFDPFRRAALEARFHPLMPSAAATIPAGLAADEMIALVRRIHDETPAGRLRIA